ncbi:alpha/beta fold hydrolase [Photobacterium atrarenae]|uniref:Alpha/beta hydrolase n=1 Tax=Photobacterium atrarenae TaxID=865757 RepID=A0ABY5GN01_9GAMM|nr:alpha/beta hydrolase [Photobacterium atrarenae]UTV30617.1 alpha/beta hydrolase [Photobacterium atrarenae]
MTHSLLNQALEKYASNEPESDIDLFSPQYVNIGKFDIRYVRYEKKNAPTLVLLNGLPQSIRMWEHGWEMLCRHFNLIAFDIPGFGLSKAQESDMSPRKLSQVIIQVLDHFEISKAHLIGPDVGTPIALAAAIEYPDRFESLNIFDGPGSYPAKMSPILKAVINFGLVRWLAKGLNKKSVMATNFNTAVKDGYHSYRPTRRAIKEYYDIAFDEQAHRCAITFFGSYPKDLSWIQTRLKDICLPTLITWGKLDPFVFVSNADDLSKQIPFNKLVVFDNASHFSSEDAGEEYLNLITHWCLGDYQHL